MIYLSINFLFTHIFLFQRHAMIFGFVLFSLFTCTSPSTCVDYLLKYHYLFLPLFSFPPFFVINFLHLVPIISHYAFRQRSTSSLMFLTDLTICILMCERNVFVSFFPCFLSCVLTAVNMTTVLNIFFL